MKRKFIITQVAEYEVRAEDANAALARFRGGEVTEFPSKIRKPEMALFIPPPRPKTKAKKPAQPRGPKKRRRVKRRYKNYMKMSNREWGQRIRRALEAVRRPF